MINSNICCNLYIDVMETCDVNKLNATLMVCHVEKQHTWDSKKRWAGCDSHDFWASHLLTTSFMLGLTWVLSIQNLTTMLQTSKDKTSFLFALSHKAQRTISMQDSRPNCLSIPLLKFLLWIFVNKLVWQMLIRESNATIGINTFWARWSSLE